MHVEYIPPSTFGRGFIRSWFKNIPIGFIDKGKYGSTCSVGRNFVDPDIPPTGGNNKSFITRRKALHMFVEYFFAAFEETIELFMKVIVAHGVLYNKLSVNNYIAFFAANKLNPFFVPENQLGSL
jgi:hypothetical protein